MMIDNETDGFADTESTDTSETSSNTDLKQELEFLKSQNAELSQTMKTFMASQQQKSEPKALSKDEFSKLMTDDPQAAIEYALSSKVNAQTSQIAKTLTAQQQAQFYDEKAERDFPLIKKDKQFAELVKNETKRLINLGVPQDSPQLVYEAAEKASLKYKGAQDTKGGNQAMSSEAPSNVQKKSSDGKLTKNQEKLASMFNLSDKARARVIENIKYRTEVDARKRGSN